MVLMDMGWGSLTVVGVKGEGGRSALLLRGG